MSRTLPIIINTRDRLSPLLLLLEWLLLGWGLLSRVNVLRERAAGRVLPEVGMQP